MSTSWSEVIENPDERKVFESLADPHWDYRTVDGIQKASGLPPEKVQDILHKYEGAYIRRSSVPDRQGRELYTLQTDRADVQEILRKLRTFISKSVG
jgi:hypothetical protein